MSDIRRVLNRLSEIEERIIGTEFVAPVTGPRQWVILRYHGINYRLRTNAPHSFRGLGVFLALGPREANFIEEANRVRARKYLTKLEPYFVIATYQDERDRWHCVSARSDSNYDGTVSPWLIPVRVRQFDTILCRYDGVNFWFQDISMHHSQRAHVLRQSLEERQAANFHISGMTPSEKVAYRSALEYKLSSDMHPDERRLRASVISMGGEFIGYEDKDDVFNVTYRIAGHENTTTVFKDTLIAWNTPGVCLDGMDTNFNLASMMSVMRAYHTRRPRHGETF